MDENNLINHINEIKHIRDLVLGTNDLSAWTRLEPILKKDIIMSCASFYENYVKLEIFDQAFRSLIPKEHAFNFFQKAVTDKYFKFLDFKGTNCNGFLKRFGNDFYERVRSKLDGDTDLLICESNFWNINKARNTIAHENYIDQNIQFSFDDLHEYHTHSMRFLDFLKKEVTE